jgi:hypothetical protein
LKENALLFNGDAWDLAENTLGFPRQNNGTKLIYILRNSIFIEGDLA